MAIGFYFADVFRLFAEPTGWKYLAVIIPMGLFNLIGSLVDRSHHYRAGVSSCAAAACPGRCGRTDSIARRMGALPDRNNFACEQDRSCVRGTKVRERTGLTPTACIRTSTCTGSGRGVDSSTSFITSGPPNCSTRIAFMISASLLVRRR